MSSEAFQEVLSSLALSLNFFTEVVNSSYLSLLFTPFEFVLALKQNYQGSDRRPHKYLHPKFLLHQHEDQLRKIFCESDIFWWLFLDARCQGLYLQNLKELILLAYLWAISGLLKASWRFFYLFCLPVRPRRDHHTRPRDLRTCPSALMSPDLLSFSFRPSFECNLWFALKTSLAAQSHPQQWSSRTSRWSHKCEAWTSLPRRWSDEPLIRAAGQHEVGCQSHR